MMNKSKLEGKISIKNDASTKTATIDIEGYIGASWWDENDNSKERVKNELKAIADIKADHIVVNINSLGGDVNHGISIHDLLAEHPAKVTTKINGMTASAATVIAMAGDERKMSANALGLVHEASTGLFGNANDLRATIDTLEKVNNRIVSIYAKRGGQDEQVYRELMAANDGDGKWIDADEMLAYGLITEVYEPTKMAASVSSEILAAYGLPGLPLSANHPPAVPSKGDGIGDKILEALSFLWNGEKKVVENKEDKKLEKVDISNEMKELQDANAELTNKVNDLVSKVENLVAQNSALQGEVETLKNSTPEKPTVVEGDEGGKKDKELKSYENDGMAQFINANFKK